VRILAARRTRAKVVKALVAHLGLRCAIRLPHVESLPRSREGKEAQTIMKQFPTKE